MPSGLVFAMMAAIGVGAFFLFKVGRKPDTPVS